MRKKYLPAILIAFAISVQTNSQDSVKVKSEFVPDLDGILKTKVEYDLDNSLVRFEVRNARFGAKGMINDYMSYRVEIDLSDEGKMKMLDAYVRFTPVRSLDFYMGQRKIPFSTDYMRNPADNIFANRSFLAKYINDGLRDIGFYADYKGNTNFPVNILLGAVNGTGNNNPQWINRPNLVGRIVTGPLSGFRAAGSAYFGQAKYRENLAMFGGELRYSNNSFFIESEYIRRNWTDTLSSRIHDDGIYLHSYYNFTRQNKVICLITPTARVDLMGTSVFGNDVDASRLTLGINFGFDPRQFYAEIRINYEDYFKSSLPIHTDKMTIEFIGRF
ncbi:MAG: porin [Bacteroidota bacterium]